MGIKATAKRIYEIRKAMGYSTKEQRARGPEGEVKFIENMTKGLKKGMFRSCGGFSFKPSSSGKSVIITPEFRFIHQLKKIKRRSK